MENGIYAKFNTAKGAILVAQKGQGDGYTLANLHTYSVIEIAQFFDNCFV